MTAREEIEAMKNGDWFSGDIKKKQEEKKEQKRLRELKRFNESPEGIAAQERADDLTRQVVGMIRADIGLI